MAVIGFIRQEEMEFKDGEDVKKAKWLECYFRVAGLRPFKAKLAKNKQKENNEKAPDYNIYLRANINKGDSFRDIKIGAVWLKNKEKEGGKIESYLTGNIEIDFRQINILIQKPKKYYDDEKIGFLYEIIAFLDDNTQKENNIEYGDAYEPPVANYEYTEADMADIPF